MNFGHADLEFLHPAIDRAARDTGRLLDDTWTASTERSGLRRREQPSPTFAQNRPHVLLTLLDRLDRFGQVLHPSILKPKLPVENPQNDPNRSLFPTCGKRDSVIPVRLHSGWRNAAGRDGFVLR